MLLSSSSNPVALLCVSSQSHKITDTSFASGAIVKVYTARPRNTRDAAVMPSHCKGSSDFIICTVLSSVFSSKSCEKKTHDEPRDPDEEA